MTTTLKRVIGLLLGTGSYALLTLLLAGAAAVAPPRRSRQRPRPPRRRSPAPPESSPDGTDELAYGAAARRDLRIYDRPGGQPRRAVQEDQPERGADGLRRRRAAGRGELQAELVPGPAPPQAERPARLGARSRREGRRGTDADRRRPLRAARDALPARASACSPPAQPWGRGRRPRRRGRSTSTSACTRTTRADRSGPRRSGSPPTRRC